MSGIPKSNHIKCGLEFYKVNIATQEGLSPACRLPQGATWWQEPALVELTPGMILGFEAHLFCQELGISLLAGMHFTSVVQENRARKKPVTPGLSLCHPASWHAVARDGVTLPFPDLPTPTTPSSSSKKN